MLLLPSILLSPLAFASDEEQLAGLLEEFLAGVDTVEAHDRFWADDLIYTSSSGTRTNKAEILAGFGNSAAADTAEPGPAYAAEDAQINVYGTTAVVAFRLVATEPDESQTRYLNTGTFLLRNGLWQVVAWQATRIPDWPGNYRICQTSSILAAKSTTPLMPGSAMIFSDTDSDSEP